MSAVPDTVLVALRDICMALPEAYEEPAWIGTRWRVRRRTFAHVLLVADGSPRAYARAAGTDGPAVVLTFRSVGPEREALRGVGHPFFVPEWGRPEAGLVLGDAVDWREVGELLVESYCALAPPRLVGRVERPPGQPSIRLATADDVPAIAHIWRVGWLHGHLGHVPDELRDARPPGSFAPRAAQRIGLTQVATIADEVVGFTVVVGDEVEQVYVAPEHRGTEVAPVLLAAAEDSIVASGHARAWLAVVAGNTRARRFYERHGWQDAGPFTHTAEGRDGPIAVPAHRYVKDLTASSR